MRRRTLLATAIGALAGLEACSGTFGKSAPGPTPSIAPMPTPSRTPRPSPPTDTAVPSYFSDQAMWPDTRAQTNATITALHGHHLCGMIAIPELQETVSEGQCPVVVDLKGPTTWALTPDSKGSWNARLVDLAASSTPEAEATAGPTTTATPALPEISVATGPAIVDDTHAYLVAGVYYEGDSQPGGSYGEPVTCAIDVVKVSVSDYAIVASVRLVEAYKFDRQLLDRVSLNFNADHSALLIAGSKDHDAADARGFGFRLSATDLSTQFDASTVLTGSYQDMDEKGEALTAMDENSKAVFVYLTNGTTETTEDEWRIERVQDDWIYYYTTRATPGAGDSDSSHMRSLTTGDSVALSRQREHFHNMYTSDIHTGQHEVILYGTYTKPTFSVRQPGATTPMLSWASDERAVPRAACVFGDIAYTTTPDRPEYKGNATLQLTSLSSGQDIGQVPIDTDNGPIAVSAWGLALQGAFYPANGWMDHPGHSTPSDAPEETATATATAT